MTAEDINKASLAGREANIDDIRAFFRQRGVVITTERTVVVGRASWWKYVPADDEESGLRVLYTQFLLDFPQ